MLKAAGYDVRCVLTAGGAEFVTPLSLEALSQNKSYGALFSLTDELEMGHIRLSRAADLVVVAPASADIMGKMAGGLADDLASTILLATDKPVMIAPAMNVKMWQHPAVQRNAERLRQDGIIFIGPDSGSLACGEEGEGRMAEPAEIFAAIEGFFDSRDSSPLLRGEGREGGGEVLAPSPLPPPWPSPLKKGGGSGPGALKGLKALVTAGPTFAAIDSVRYIANRSSGKQGYAIAEALSQAGAEVVLVTGPVALSRPNVARIIEVESAAEMYDACMKNLAVDIAVMAAAVADWQVANVPSGKLKKSGGGAPQLKFQENPDILKPRLVIGFAAETEKLLENAKKKLQYKKCDWILANDVSLRQVFGKDENQILFVEKNRHEKWPKMSKKEVAEKLVEKIIQKIRNKK